MRLLFVCTGNTCRSPLAVAAWQAFGAPLLQAKGIESVVDSAGLSASPGAPVAPHSIAVAREWGVDLSGHQARRLAPGMVQGADHLVAMTAQHAQTLRARFGAKNVLQLGDYAGDSADSSGRSLPVALGELRILLDGVPGDILDPFGGSLEAYQACGAHIRRAVEGLAAALRDGKLRDGKVSP